MDKKKVKMYLVVSMKNIVGSVIKHLEGTIPLYVPFLLL